MEEEVIKSELELLKERADLLGIKYSRNVALETLRAKVNERLENADVKREAKISLQELRKREIAEQTKLVRIRLTVMNPIKAAWRGEVITVTNNIFGTVKKFVPFESRFYANGYHVPQCILNVLKRRKYLKVTVDDKGRIKEKVYVPEFSIEILPTLTPSELTKLAADQRAGNRID